MNLAVKLPGQSIDLNLKNPVLTASGTFGYGREFAPYGDLNALGGFIVKGLSLAPRPGNSCPRIIETTAGMLNAIGLQNDGVEHFCQKILPEIAAYNTAIIANIYGGTVEEFFELAARLNHEEKVSALEVNISCPNVKHGGVLFGQDPKMAAQVTAAVRRGAPNKHIIVKLSPNVTSIIEIAKSVEGAGADSVSCINTLLGLSVDLKTHRPSLANIVGGLSGPAIKPVALRSVWQVAKNVQIPVIGVGGITNAYDVLEFILVGAKAIQIGTANFISPTTAFDIVRTLPTVCQELGITSLDDFCGSLEC